MTRYIFDVQNLASTVWKSKNFSATKIFREINVDFIKIVAEALISQKNYESKIIKFPHCAFETETC